MEDNRLPANGENTPPENQEVMASDSTSPKPSNVAETVFDKKKYLTLKEYIFIGLVNLGEGMRNSFGSWASLVTVVFMKFQPETVLQLSVFTTVWGFIMMPYNLWVARTIDKSKNLKRFVYIFAAPAAILGVLGTVPLGLLFPGMPELTKLIYVIVVTIISGLLNSFNTMSQEVLNIRITPSSKERANISMIRNVVYGTISGGGPVIMMLVTAVFKSTVDQNLDPKDAEGIYYMYAAAITALIALPMTISYVYVQKVRIASPPKPKKDNLLVVAREMVKNRPIMTRFSATMLTQWVAITGSVGFLVRLYIFAGTEVVIFGKSLGVANYATLSFIFTLSKTLPSTISLLFVPFFRKRFSDKSLYIFQRYFTAVISILTLVFVSDIFDTGASLKLILALAFYGASSFTIGFNISGDVMSREALDYAEWQTGKRSDATVGQIQGVMGTLNGLVIGLVATFMLVNFIGFPTDQTDVILNDGQKQKMLLLAYGAPGIVTALGSIPLFFYNMTGKTRARVMCELAETRKKQAQAQQETAAS